MANAPVSYITTKDQSEQALLYVAGREDALVEVWHPDFAALAYIIRE